MSFLKDYKYQREIIAYREYIKEHQTNLDDIHRKMNDLYKFMKNIAPEYANKSGFVDADYRMFVNLLYKTEKCLPIQFILKNEPDFNFTKNFVKISPEVIKDKDEIEIVEYIVHRVRSFMAASFCHDHDEANVDLGKVDLLDCCAEASGKVYFVCCALGLYSRDATITPAFYDERNIYEKGNNHVFVAVQIGARQFVIDLTYSQFFQIKNNNYNRLGIPFLGGCAPGFYMTLNEERRAFAENLMRKGYFEVTKENVKLYFDGFAMSYRNGLYYEDMFPIIYQTDYEAEDYLKFIAKEDHQLNHEKRLYLGRQKKILKNPEMSFRPHIQ